MQLKELIIALILVIFALPVLAGENLVENPDFKLGLEHWKIKFPEPNEKKYGRNHQQVQVVANPAGPGNCIVLNVVGELTNAGVKAVTGLMPVEKGVTYEFGGDILSEGPPGFIFLEGYVVDPDRTMAGDNQYPGFRRIYRKKVPYGATDGKWQTLTRQATPPARYQPTHVLLKLYAYEKVGKVFFTNLIFTPVTNDKP